MIFKRLIFTLLTTLSLFSCVGQKEDSDISPEEKKEEEEKKKGTVFLRRILATEFTATWCVYCPDMKESIAKVSESHAGRIVEMAVHYADGMDCTPGDSLTDLFSVEMWPTAVFNMSPEWKTSSVSATVLTAMVDTILSHTSPVCGIKAKSILIDNNLSVTVSM